MLWSICMLHSSVPYMNTLSLKCYMPYAHILSFNKGSGRDKIKLNHRQLSPLIAVFNKKTLAGIVLSSSPFLPPTCSPSAGPAGSPELFRIWLLVLSSSAISKSRSCWAPAWISEAPFQSNPSPLLSLFSPLSANQQNWWWLSVLTFSLFFFFLFWIFKATLHFTSPDLISLVCNWKKPSLI